MVSKTVVDSFGGAVFGMGRCRGRNERGQGTVEAAFIIPVLFIALLLLVQPGILLYDRLVMQAAAAEGCRLLATKTSTLGDMTESCEAFIRHRLGAIPSQDCFHRHAGGCTWEIDLQGAEGSDVVTVTIGNTVKLLPLFDAGAAFLGMADAQGNIRLEVSISMPTQPAWVEGSPLGHDPSGWIGAWLA